MKKHGLYVDFDQKKVSALFKHFDKDNSNDLDFKEVKELVKQLYLAMIDLISNKI